MKIEYTTDTLNRLVLVMTQEGKYFCKCTSTKRNLKKSKIDFICNQLVDFTDFSPKFFHVLTVNGFSKYQLGLKE